MESIAPIGVRTVTQLIDHAATRLDDASMLLAKPKAAGGRREAGIAILGALHEVRLSMERVGASGVPVESALAKLTAADELILERVPNWAQRSEEMSYSYHSVHKGSADSALSAATKAVRELGASRKLDAAIAAAPDAAPMTRDESMAALEALVKALKTDSSGRVAPLPLEGRILVERVTRADIMLTERARRTLTAANAAVAALTPNGDGVLPMTPQIKAQFVALASAIRTERAAGAAIRDARDSIDEFVAEHLRIMRAGDDLASPPTTSEFVEMVASHASASADSTAQLVDSGRYRLLSRRLQRWQDSGESIRHAYDAAVSASRAQLVARRIPDSADEYVGQLRSDVTDLSGHAFENMLRVKEAAARGPIRRTLLATSIRPETLERADLHDTIANRAAQIQARHGEPLHRLESYRAVFEDLGTVGAEVAP